MWTKTALENYHRNRLSVRVFRALVNFRKWLYICSLCTCMCVCLCNSLQQPHHHFLSCSFLLRLFFPNFLCPPLQVTSRRNEALVAPTEPARIFAIIRKIGMHVALLIFANDWKFVIAVFRLWTLAKICPSSVFTAVSFLPRVQKYYSKITWTNPKL